MATPYRHMERRVHWQPRGEELKYLRRDGNRMVRARRRRRTALRLSTLAAVWIVAAAVLGACALAAARWAVNPAHFRLATVTVKGAGEARESEILDLLGDRMGRNILTLDLTDVEQAVRRHPWVGAAGAVRVQRRLPDGLAITVAERSAGGLALLSGEVWLLDVNGMPIDRFGPRYARWDFPIIKGLDGMRPPVGAADAAAGASLARALARGVAVTRALSGARPELYAQVSEIDVSDPDMVALRLEGLAYDLRLSPDDPLRNLDSWLAIRKRIESDEEDGVRIDYVDLRWKDRVAVMPVRDRVGSEETHGGR